MTVPPDVSVLIVTFNGRNYVRSCLASLFAHTRDTTFEVIVIDNASADGTPDMIEREFPAVEAIRRATNAGFAAGVNEGLRRAGGRACFIVNPDTEVSSDVISPMVRFLDEHPDVGVLGPKLLDEDGTLQLSCRAFPDYGTALFNRYSLLTRVLPSNRASSRYLMTDFDHTTTRDVDWLSGAAWMLPRSAVDKVGLLDEAYFWSIEDVDYCQRVHRAGLRVVYFPDVSVAHRIGGSSASAPSRALIARHRGMWRYYGKYLAPSNALARAIVGTVVATGIALRCAGQLTVGALRRRS
jgi:GT2 family glycosyltransferase